MSGNSCGKGFMQRGPGVIMSLDFKKGFDTINHNFLFSLLEELRFKESFIRWIQTLYNNAYSKVINYGWISGQFSSRGVYGKVAHYLPFCL